MSLYSFLHKDTIVYDKFNHFINDPRFNALINDYLNSNIDDFYALSANSNTRICLNKDKLVVSVNPLPQPINSYDHGYPNEVLDTDDRFHSVLDRTLTYLEEILYQGQ